MPYKDPELAKEKSKERWLSWAQRNPEVAAQRARTWRRNHPEQMLHISAKRRAQKLDIPFNIDVDDIVIPEYCPITKLKLEINQEGSHGPSMNSPTLDRIHPELGYTKGNIAVISFKANKWKSDMTKQDIEILLNYINTAPGLVGTTLHNYVNAFVKDMSK